MIASFMITFRETLEAALVVGIIWSYLVRTDNRVFLGLVIKGGAAGIVASIFGAWIFQAIAGGFEGRAEEIFEGITMLIGATLLTSMILWMMTRNASRELEEGVARAVGKASGAAVFFLVFFSILREGIETVLFLSSASMLNGGNVMSGAVLGIVIATLIGWLFFKGAMQLNLKTVFNLSSVLLILFAAGLFAHGVHELQEAHLLPVFVEHVWDINPEVVREGVYPLLHEKGAIGAIFKGLFGYNGNPTLLEVITYLMYITFAVATWQMVITRRRAVSVPVLQ
jgi:high-affinity iron transporter